MSSEECLRTILELGRMMRNDRLSRPELSKYQALLEERLNSNPDDLDTWRELRVLCIGYLHDLDSAAEAVARALAHFPDDREMSRWQDVLAVWQADVRQA